MMRRAVALITQNFLWKLMSVAASIMFWVALVDSPELTTSVPVSIEFRNYPQDLDTGSQSVDRVQLQVRGPREALSPSSFERTAAVIDLSSIRQPTERTFELSRAIAGLPPRVSIIRTVPSQLRIRLERHVTREVPIRTPSAPDGVRFLQAEMNPDRAVISGPQSQVEQVDFVQTDPLDSGTIEGAVEDKPILTKLNTFVDNPRVRIDSVSTVDIKILIERVRD